MSIPSVIEVSNSAEVNSEPYISEGSTISYMTTNDARKRSYVDGGNAAYWLRSINIAYTYLYSVNELGDLYGFNTPSSKLGVLIEISF